MITTQKTLKILKSVGNSNNYMDLDIASGISQDTTESSFKDFLLNEYGLTPDYLNPSYNDILAFYEVNSIKELKELLQEQEKEQEQEITEILTEKPINKDRLKKGYLSTDFILSQIPKHKPKKEYVTIEQKKVKRLTFLEMCNKIGVKPAIRC